MQHRPHREDGAHMRTGDIKPPYYKTWSKVSLGLKLMLSLVYAKRVTVTTLPRVPPCFGRHVKLLLPAAFAVVGIQLAVDVRPVAGRKINGESLSQHDENMLYRPYLVG
jgi:hypothetical protein